MSLYRMQRVQHTVCSIQLQALRFQHLHVGHLHEGACSHAQQYVQQRLAAGRSHCRMRQPCLGSWNCLHQWQGAWRQPAIQNASSAFCSSLGTHSTAFMLYHLEIADAVVERQCWQMGPCQMNGSWGVGMFHQPLQSEIEVGALHSKSKRIYSSAWLNLSA